MATILLVEDEDNIRELVNLRLSIQGHDVSEAVNGLEGMEKALAIQPDLVLLDMHMPVMSGHEAARALREKEYSGLVIALTASAMIRETNRAKESGCDGVITKPISEQFEDQVAALLAERGL